MKPNGKLDRELAELHRQMARLEVDRRQIVQPATMQEIKSLTLGQRVKGLLRRKLW